MKDKWDKFLAQKLKVMIDLLSSRNISTENLYRWYYKWIIQKLKSDLLEAQNNMANLTLIESNAINKIWIMWWQGLDQAPELVKNNYRIICSIFGKENVILINQQNYKNYTNIQENLLKKLKSKQITYTLWSDIVRYNLLLNNGGLWIDSTVVLSKKFYEYFKEVEDKEFISLCSEKENNRYISKGKWTGWFIGGKRNYDLFRFITCFFEVYFKNHNISIDYMLVDDAVHYYYTKNKLYQKIIDEQAREWDPYLFTRNYKSTDLDEIFEMFNGKIKYSVQKFSYKINTEKDISNNSLYCILCKKSKTGLNEKKNEK